MLCVKRKKYNLKNLFSIYNTLFYNIFLMFLFCFVTEVSSNKHHEGILVMDENRS